jgi:glycosyltransferase involved in cell wall biosynthesis
MLSSSKKLVWLVSGNTFTYNDNGDIVPLGHSGKWIAYEINSEMKQKSSVIVLPLKGLKSYFNLLQLDLSDSLVRIQGVEFFYSLVSFLLVRRRAMEIEFDLQGFPQDIAKRYFTGGWFRFPEALKRPLLIIREIVKWTLYYMRGLISTFLLNQNVGFRGRTDYDKNKIRKPLYYLRKERYVRNIEVVDHLHFNELVVLVPQAHYPTKGLHLIIDDLYDCARDLNLRVLLGGTKPKGYYGYYLEKRLESVIHNLQLEYIQETDYNYDDILACCDVVLLPSIVENSSNSIREARSLGKTCLVQSSGGNLEMIKGYSRGFCYDFNQAEEFKKVFKEIYGQII